LRIEDRGLRARDSQSTILNSQFLCRDVAQPGSAHAWGACGRRFESSRPDQLSMMRIEDGGLRIAILNFLSSILITSTRGVAQLGSALGSGPRGRRFKSSRPDLT
jgi:hypothetical protein